MCGFLLRFGRGVSSTCITLSAGQFLQFPRRGLRAADPCTRSETVLSQNCLTVGLSLRPPLNVDVQRRIQDDLGRIVRIVETLHLAASAGILPFLQMK